MPLRNFLTAAGVGDRFSGCDRCECTWTRLNAVCILNRCRRDEKRWWPRWSQESLRFENFHRQRTRYREDVLHKFLHLLKCNRLKFAWMPWKPFTIRASVAALTAEVTRSVYTFYAVYAMQEMHKSTTRMFRTSFLNTFFVFIIQQFETRVKRLRTVRTSYQSQYESRIMFPRQFTHLINAVHTIHEIRKSTKKNVSYTLIEMYPWNIRFLFQNSTIWNSPEKLKNRLHFKPLSIQIQDYESSSFYNSLHV